MRNLLAAFFLVVSICCTAAQMSELEFTQYFVKHVAAAKGDIQLNIVQPLQVQAKATDGNSFTVFLTNAYTQYKADQNDLVAIVDSQIRSIQSQQELFGAKKNSTIFAVIKPADYLTNVKKQLAQAGLADKDIPLLYKKISDDLYVFYVFDTENGMRMVTKQDLAAQKIDEKAIHGIAIDNLGAYFEKKKVNIKLLNKGKVYVVSLDQNYEASVLLLEKYWNKQNFDVAGALVAFVPARNTVIVTGSK